jgi:hypothetical protein
MAVQVNGNFFQHSLVNASATGTGASFQFRLFSAISYSDSGEKEAVLDSRGEIAGYVVKPRKTDGKIKLKQMEWNSFRDWLMVQAQLLTAQTNRPFGPGQVEITISLNVGVTPAAGMKRDIRCLVQQEAFDSTDDQNPLEVEVPLFVIDVTDGNGRRFIERG